MSQPQNKIALTQGNHKPTRRGSRGGSNNGSPSSFTVFAAKPSTIPLPTEGHDQKTGILTWGKNNQYPYFLNYLFKNNPIHGGIIRAKKHFTVSGGVTYEGINQIAFDEFIENKKTSPKDKNVLEILDDLSLDYEKSNLFAVLVYFSFVGEKKYRKIERIPFETIRFEETKDEKGNLFLTGNIKISDNWLDSKVAPEIIKPFNKNDPSQTKCFVLFKEESGASIDTPTAKELNLGIYPDPPYGGAITQIDTGIQTGIWGNAEIHNGYSLGTMIYLAGGQPKNDKVKKDLERDLGASTTGALQAGRSMVIYGNGQDEKPTVEALNGNNLADRYNNTKKTSEESTIHGHQVVVPSLFGVKPEGSFNASELEIGYAIMQSNYFEGRRSDLSAILNYIMNDIAGVQGKFIINQPELKLPKEEVQPQFQVNLNTEKQENQDIDLILERLQMRGSERSSFTILHSEPIVKGLELSRDQLLANAKQSFDEVTDLQAQVLNLINQGENFDSIRKALDISGVELSKLYNRLATLNLIDKVGALTEKGKIQNSLNEVEKIEIMYEYRLRSDAPALEGQSRKFCKTLIGLNRLYTREEISLISGNEGYDVFAYRGGWYTNPDTKKHEPGCRHEWAQVITFKN